MLKSSLKAHHRSAAGRVLVAAIGAACLSFSVVAHAGGDAAAGKEKAATCGACHGADGNSSVPTNPILAGQYESYLVQALQSYRDGSRQNAIMSGFAAKLSDADIADLAAWFSSQASDLKTAPRP